MRKNYDTDSPEAALDLLVQGNRTYLKSRTNPADISPVIRKETAEYGQKPYAVILTCSDSRVPPEHIFSAGIGDLFVVRTAGNVVGEFELGSIEYATEHLGAKIVLVMGHSQCGAVEAALEGHADGYIEDIIYEIQLGLHGETDEAAAIHNNTVHSKNRIMESGIIRNLVSAGKLAVICSNYHLASGIVDFFEC